MSDTIYAPATAAGRAGVSIIRISGPEARPGAAALAGSLPPPRVAALRTLRDGEATLDRALVLRFDAPESYTGEDVVELHIHGSVAVQRAVLRALAQKPGFRFAEPGEFTRRALENGRLDLAQVEGLSDLIDAETEQQRRQAQRLFEGALGAKAEAWRRDLLRAAALVEAVIDFADEAVPVDVGPEVATLIDGVARGLAAELRGFGAAERVRDGFEVAIVGAPNAGKSTLLNRLAGREAAITSEFAGTTRDVIEVRMELAGLPVTFLDTAGLREADDPVERIGISRAMARARAADLRVVLVEQGSAPPEGLELGPEDIVLTAKCDLAPDAGAGVSGLTGEGVGALVGQVTDTLALRVAGASTITRERHRVAVAAAREALEAAGLTLGRGMGYAEIAAEEIRSAIRSLESVVGRLDVEHVLGEIFSRFCIGK
jgi:tRNA modification GTPase